jgi:hypothetical protein
VYAFALGPASAYNLIDANHPNLVAETFCFAPRQAALRHRRAEFPTKATLFFAKMNP